MGVLDDVIRYRETKQLPKDYGVIDPRVRDQNLEKIINSLTTWMSAT